MRRRAGGGGRGLSVCRERESDRFRGDGESGLRRRRIVCFLSLELVLLRSERVDLDIGVETRFWYCGLSWSGGEGGRRFGGSRVKGNGLGLN